MKIMNLKKFFKFTILGPIIPLIGVPGDESGNDSNGANENDDDDDDDENNNNNDDNQGNKNDKNEKTYTTDEINKIIEKRLSRERKKIAKEFNEKIERKNLDENERLKLEKADAERKAQETLNHANNRLIKSEIISKAATYGVIDNDAVYALIDKSDIEIDENGNISGVDDALKTLLEKKSYLIKKTTNESNNNTGDDQSQKDKKSKFDMNSLIRKATGRS